MPEWLQALVLGLVQGLTEFIPVSSSGHLVLVPAWLGWQRPGLAFDVALHVGTLVALLVYFRRDLGSMARAVFASRDQEHTSLYRRQVLLLALASLPVAIAGLTLRPHIERAFEAPRLAALLLLVTAALLASGEAFRRRRVRRARADDSDAAATPVAAATMDVGYDPADRAGIHLGTMTWRHALIVGIGQAAAIMPGISRSGTTITAGMIAGMTREAATRFAFLLGIPAIAGATVVSLPDMRDLGHYSTFDLAVGMVAAAVAGYAAIAFLIRLVSRAGFSRFVGYLVIAAAASLVRFA